jgi:alpha-ribazole phosphatase
MKIALIRHPTPLIAPGTCYGHLDVPLAPKGLADIPRITATLDSFPLAGLWTSPSQRCRLVADAFARDHNIPPTPDPRLQEMDFGQWEGQPWDDIPRPDLDRWAANPLTFAAPGGESGAALIARIQTFHTHLREDGLDCAVISHGGPLKILIRLLLDEALDLLAPSPSLGSVRIVEI